MDRELPEKKKLRLFAEAMATIEKPEIVKLNNQCPNGFTAMKTILKLHISAAVDKEMEARAQTSRADMAILEKGTLVSFIRLMVCPIKLRWAIENFPIRFLSSTESAFRRQNELHSKFIKLTDYKPKQASVINWVKQLLSISTTDDTKKKSQLEGIWKHLLAIVGVIGLSQPSKPSELQVAVIDIFNASNVSDVEKAYDEYINSVKIKSKVSVDEKCIEELVNRPMEKVLEVFINQLTTDPRECEYMKNVVEYKMMFENDTTKYYRQCLWILYTSQHPGISNLKIRIETQWPTLLEPERLHRYALEYAQLYNLVSVISKHGPGLMTPPDCEPKDEDFQAYINHLAVTESQNLSFVAETLYKPLS